MSKPGVTHFDLARHLLVLQRESNLRPTRWMINTGIWQEMVDYFTDHLHSYALYSDNPHEPQLLYGIPVETDDQYHDIHLIAWPYTNTEDYDENGIQETE